MALRTIYIKSNISTVSDILVGDMGILIPSASGNHIVNTVSEFQLAKKSLDLQGLLVDNVYGVNSSTLILNNGTSDVDQSQVLDYLQNINSSITNNWFGGW